ncbi:NAD-dependent epimerase/dehydratase family protein [Microbacterium lacus]|uniref:NAD(P)-dependent oxidoreductase n=1 Tax=Microbacterium lacus TaxID=415217 RepID=A0ABN2HGF5_9MICO
MKVAITGALGIVGSIVSAHLSAAGHEAIRIDIRRPPAGEPGASESSVADLTDYNAARSALSGADAVVHLAAINNPRTAPEWQVHNTNVTSSYNVLSAAAELGIRRVVQASSVNAIGMAWSRQPRFDYLPVDLEHPSRTEDGYSLSKQIQELQADSLVRRHDSLSVVSLRLHAVLAHAADAQAGIDRFGLDWAVNGLFGYCTHVSVATAIEQAILVDFRGHERLWVVEPQTFSDEPTSELVRRYYSGVPLIRPLVGREALIDARRTREVLRWTPSTEGNSA